MAVHHDRVPIWYETLMRHSHDRCNNCGRSANVLHESGIVLHRVTENNIGGLEVELPLKRDCRVILNVGDVVCDHCLRGSTWERNVGDDRDADKRRRLQYDRASTRIRVTDPSEVASSLHRARKEARHWKTEAQKMCAERDAAKLDVARLKKQRKKDKRLIKKLKRFCKKTAGRFRIESLAQKPDMLRATVGAPSWNHFCDLVAEVTTATDVRDSDNRGYGAEDFSDDEGEEACLHDESAEGAASEASPLEHAEGSEDGEAHDDDAVARLLMKLKRKRKALDLQNLVALTLMKVHLEAATFKVLGGLFGLSRQTASRYAATMVPTLLSLLTSKHLGYDRFDWNMEMASIPAHITSDLDVGVDEEFCIVSDCTYLFVERSSNPRFKVFSYDRSKKTNLLKVLVVCDPYGRVLEVRGLFEPGSDDVILKTAVLDTAAGSLGAFLRDRSAQGKKPIVLLDRGFKYADDYLMSVGARAILPHFLGERSQFSRQEAVDNHVISTHRIVVENTNAVLKRQGVFGRNRLYRNSELLRAMDYIRLAACLANMWYDPPRKLVEEE
eukprot:TRINITY_DN2677_c0_g2_i1.p1 TRINITY_DN2677_c0_g2~~TRINITY_DN2677_c0_g2_i1.p1  ORF type:complete len:556 (+),score=103.17 TRINITY_DN2677_c0_g2_i1:495-2162(+)